MRVYAYSTLGILAALLLLTVGFCWTIDAYRVFGSVQEVEYFEPNIRLWKSRTVDNSFREIDGYILGNSRAAQLPPAAINGPGVKYFNYATSSETTSETLAKLAHVYGLGGSVREIVVFLSLEALWQAKQPLRHDLLRQESCRISGGTGFRQTCEYLLSLEAISASVDARAARDSKKKAIRYAADGTATYMWRQNHPVAAASRRKTLPEFMDEAYERELGIHRKMADLARKHGTKVCVVVGPVPDPQWTEYMDASTVTKFLAAVSEVYGTPAVCVGGESGIYRNHLHWNDPAHPTQEALVEFVAPLVRASLGR